MAKNNIIFRSLGKIERNIDENSRRIVGQAIVFDSWSRDLGGFVEKINRSAITEDLLANSDVVMNFNHNDEKILARYVNGEGTLDLELRDDGLWFSFDAPETSLGDEVLYNVRNGNLFECSFCCYLEKSGLKRYRDGDIYRQEVNSISLLHDVSIVVNAAYAATSVSARSAEEAAEEFEEIKREVDAEEAEEAARKAAEEEEKRKEMVHNELAAKREEFLEHMKNISQ